VSLVLRNVQVDVPADVHADVVRFWAAALRADPVATAGGRFVHLHDASAVVEVHVQRLDAGPARVHLDLAAGTPEDPGDVDTEVARLTAAGAEVVAVADEGWTVLRTPAGLSCCVVPGAAPADPLAPGADGGSVLDGVFVDVPAATFDAELAFWATALEADIEPTSRPRTFTALQGVRTPGGPVLFEVQQLGTGDARYHVDLIADDVPTEAARLAGLGATHVASIESWITLADPADTLLCVVPS
jgi:hypothetical protein